MIHTRTADGLKESASQLYLVNVISFHPFTYFYVCKPII